MTFLFRCAKKSVELGLLFRVFINKLLKNINILVCNFPGSNLILDISRVKKTILGSLEHFLFWFYAFEFISCFVFIQMLCYIWKKNAQKDIINLLQ